MRIVRALALLRLPALAGVGAAALSKPPHKRIGTRIVIGHRLFFGLLPALLALLLHAPIAAGKPLTISDIAAAESFERGIPLPAAVDLTTRSQRHAASIEEYFAIDEAAPAGVAVAIP